MSETLITIERVDEVSPHPNADRLDIVKVLGYQIVTGRDNFGVGDAAVYFPPDILIPDTLSTFLDVTQYLKHAVFPGDLGSSQCRVGACRLRGLPSHGFLVPVSKFDLTVCDEDSFGMDVTDYFGAHKYLPPVRQNAGDAERENLNFPQYTSIENIQRGCSIEDGTEVVITEKIHGTNVRMGLITDESEDGTWWNFAAGSHKVRRKEGEGLYWQFMDQKVKGLLMHLSKPPNEEPKNVVIYGEIFGHGVQDMDYGAGVKSLRIFDIAVEGKYLDYEWVEHFCNHAGLETVPTLYRGPFSEEIVEEYTYGETTFTGVKCKFKGREGCVVKPVKETLDYRGDRVILKSVSVDYRNRKGGTDDS